MLIAKTKVNARYQVTIPKEIRKILGIKPGDEIVWSVVGGVICVQSAKNNKNEFSKLSGSIKLSVRLTNRQRQLKAARTAFEKKWARKFELINQDIRKGRNISPGFTDARQMIKYLKKK